MPVNAGQRQVRVQDVEWINVVPHVLGDVEPSGSQSRSEHRSTEAAVLPSQIEQLPDLSGYLKLASRAEWQRVCLQTPEAQC